MPSSRFAFPFTLFTLAWLFLPLSAHAYLDPASGGYIIQVAVATILGALFAIKTYWNVICLRVTGFFSRKPEKKEDLS